MTPTNGTSNVEVLAERIANLSKKVDEQAASQKAAVDAALLTSDRAITVALATQEKTVNAAFAASEKAITKAEESQKEYNKTIGILQNDVVGLKESRSQNVGDKSAKTDDKAQSNFNMNLALAIGVNVIAFLALVWKLIQPMVK
jgi:two-component sensor histidine kinase